MGIREKRDGRYKTEAELRKKVEEYFELCKPRYLIDIDGKVLLDGDKAVFTFNAPSLNGLCRYLGFMGVNYMNKTLKHDTFRSEVLIEAKCRIAEWHESRLADKNSYGSQFWLKCAQPEIFGDKPQTHIVTKGSLTPEEESHFEELLDEFIKPKE